ncbi:hypothetical protein C2E20_4114 isoform A [Micractinium conductrix]|uniref:Uncharacterized protein n=1 Tax=Micractinium conductrix TaxID=554055 RepID=A0A2P6VFE4_9CHLO|nr:hypothetical protein C2E20_4114 isoform A [Micractinium conductrix]|eukprot:PSC72814.1 hypothetical protein C2E20_4114 isoform A [Micractinium conductrix]
MCSKSLPRRAKERGPISKRFGGLPKDCHLARPSALLVGARGPAPWLCACPACLSLGIEAPLGWSGCWWRRWVQAPAAPQQRANVIAEQPDGEIVMCTGPVRFALREWLERGLPVTQPATARGSAKRQIKKPVSLFEYVSGEEVEECDVGKGKAPAAPALQQQAGGGTAPAARKRKAPAAPALLQQAGGGTAPAARKRKAPARRASAAAAAAATGRRAAASARVGGRGG